MKSQPLLLLHLHAVRILRQLLEAGKYNAVNLVHLVVAVLQVHLRGEDSEHYMPWRASCSCLLFLCGPSSIFSVWSADLKQKGEMGRLDGPLLVGSPCALQCLEAHVGHLLCKRFLLRLRACGACIKEKK